MFIVTYYIISLMLSLFITTFDTNIIVGHFMGIIKTPYELAKAIIGR